MIPISKPLIGDAEKQAVLSVLDSGMLVQGPRVAALEEQFAEACRTRHAVATSSGTAALHIALLAHGIGPGDQVVTTPFTFIASASSILLAGAEPVLVDIDADTFNLDPALLEAAITPKTRAIMPVHLYGHPCDMDAILDIAGRHNLVVVEDAAQAIGASYRGQPVGSFGTGCFSLYATKNIMAGEGGMITTNDENIAESCRLLRNHGMKRRYYHDRLGHNLRMTDLHAAIALAQLDRLEEFAARRQANAAYFSSHLTSVSTPQVQEGCTHAWHQYTVRVDGDRDRDKALESLHAAGVGAAVYYPVPVHHQAYIRDLVGHTRLPVAERAASEVLSLPVHPGLNAQDLDTIVKAVNTL
ncbi:MAG: DegT/DnrJ/EryC1/StrS aminotransferase family protein [Anaerolineae bacterium]|jgi:dTDP-4-amino-4,6-dideoxygalactose transaminase